MQKKNKESSTGILSPEYETTTVDLSFLTTMIGLPGQYDLWSGFGLKVWRISIIGVLSGIVAQAFARRFSQATVERSVTARRFSLFLFVVMGRLS